MDKKALAFEDWKNGAKYKEIAEKYNINLSTVKSWASRYWKKESCNQKNKKVATKRKSKSQHIGAPKGNKNAVGHGAPIGNKNNYKHGLYEKVYWDTLDEEEVDLINSMDFEEEQSLMDQIKLLTIRERRLMKSIKAYKDTKGGLALNNVIKRKLETTGDVESQQEETTTTTVSTFEVIMKLEAELTRVQSKKTKCIEALNKIRTERKNAEDGEKGNELVDDWINAVMGEDDNE